MQTGRDKLFADLEANGFRPVDLDIISIQNNTQTFPSFDEKIGQHEEGCYKSTVDIISRSMKAAVETAVKHCEAMHAVERARFVAEAEKLAEEVSSLREQLAKLS